MSPTFTWDMPTKSNPSLYVTSHNIANFLHNEKNPYFCEQCKAQFPNYEPLKEHITSKHKIEFKCTMCSSIFPRKYELAKHLFYQHDQKEEATCPICKKVFAKSSILVTDLS